MKVLLVLASFVAVAYGGVGILSLSEEQDALRLWQQYCAGASDQGNDGNTFIYCKRAREDTSETLQHTIEVTPGPETPRQVVFVQPPSTNYKHNVVINGQAGQQQKTTIYVLPQKNTHTLDYEDNRDKGGAPIKPSLYFLKNNPNEESVDSQPAPPPGAYPPPRPDKGGGGYSYNAPKALF